MIDTETRYLLEDMVEHARAGLGFVTGKSLGDFKADTMLIYAASRGGAIVGEAAYQVTPAAQATLPSLPWRDAIAIRHKLVHGYRKIQAKIIFETIRDDSPALIAELERLLNERLDDGA